MKSFNTGQVRAFYFHCNPNCSSSAGQTLHATQAAPCHFNSSLHGSQPILSNHRGLSIVQSSLFHEASSSTAHSGYIFFYLLLFHKLMKYGVSMILAPWKTHSVNVLSRKACLPKHLHPHWEKAAVYMRVCHSWGETFRLKAVWKTLY